MRLSCEESVNHWTEQEIYVIITGLKEKNKDRIRHILYS